MPTDRPKTRGRQSERRSSGGYRPREARHHDDRPEKLPLSPQVLRQRGLALDPDAILPRCIVKSPSPHPWIYRKRMGSIPSTAQHGDIVELGLLDESRFGYGLFNPRSEIAVRVLTRGDELPTEEWFRDRITAAVELRRQFLDLGSVSTAYRIIHAEADGLPGITADLLGQVISVESFSLGMFQRAEAIARMCAGTTKTPHWIVRPGPLTLEQEGFDAEAFTSPDCPVKTTIEEDGTQFEIRFRTGHKTGFFCDQRENRRQLAAWTKGGSVLDACCYTGGFAIQAARLGDARDVTGIDLDEAAIQGARRNAQINKLSVRFTQADAFHYLRDMAQTGRQFDVVVLDPPKFIRNRDERDIGRKKYYDLNRLASAVVSPGGLLLTCTCSGLMPADDFVRTVGAAIPAERRAMVLARTGAAKDHPVALGCLDSEYLHAVWLRMGDGPSNSTGS